ncbi:hypothetical protein GYMLUDRAFT_45533 [Collybiopsis luxurians FD-317 M1]|uniref:Peroxidase n=1 Tax=Collybiopsis luxurians FD-317 M1 TaxID=944289 RepID=A0A0D0CRQ9_9AGAR|nr:hypothetical protein GYMLUDRAFT_45533 [Collybiopsis luxurians FD-317 M1]
MLSLNCRTLFFETTLFFSLVHWALGIPTYQWPDPRSRYIDKVLYEDGPDLLVSGCTPRFNSTISAQWLRVMFHDMSTHNVDDGTGGLDASINFELERPQNIGEGQTQSLVDFMPFTTTFFGLADTIAFGAALAVLGCGGPVIPFRAGRIDATSAGPATVPQPQEDLATHIESFRRQGFNITEMISLVACGHTLGGIRHADFPLIVTDNDTDVALFDTTKNFDNVVVSQYLQNTSQDVLVVGPNVTTRSDFRIFSSDGNVTMRSFLNNETFFDTCANLIERMINTVPNGVTLTDPIDPLQYLVYQPLLSYQNGTLIMTTALRLINASDNPSRTITLFWADRRGSFCPSTGCSVQTTGTQFLTTNIYLSAKGYNATKYLFNATINASTSISKFWFEINENDGSQPVAVDNGGSGFSIAQDSVFIDSLRSKTVFTSTDIFLKVVVAVRGDSNATSVAMTTFDPTTPLFNPTPPFLPNITVMNLELDESNPPEGGFTFFSGAATQQVTTVNYTGSVVGGTTFNVNDFDLKSVTFDLEFE